MPPDYSSQDAAVLRAVSVSAAEMGLSERQLDLLVRFTRGLSRAELAAEVGVTVAAVDYHGRVIREICGLGPRELALRLLRDAVVAAPKRGAGDGAETCGGNGTLSHR